MNNFRFITHSASERKSYKSQFSSLADFSQEFIRMDSFRCILGREKWPNQGKKLSWRLSASISFQMLSCSDVTSAPRSREAKMVCFKPCFPSTVGKAPAGVSQWMLGWLWGCCRDPSRAEECCAHRIHWWKLRRLWLWHRWIPEQEIRVNWSQTTQPDTRSPRNYFCNYRHEIRRFPILLHFW